VERSDTRRERDIRVSWILFIIGGAVLVVLLAALVPTRTSDLTPRPSPARDYADALRRVQQQQRGDDRVVAAGGRSILMTHGRRTPRAVVLLHGFTNSPRQFEALAATLYATGDNVYVPRLPRHAERHGTAATLAGLTAEELRDCADSAIDIAIPLGDSVIVVGLSAGGTMAAWIAQNRAEVRRAVIIAPTLGIARVPSVFAKPLMNLALRLPNMILSDPPDPARPDRELGTSSRAIAEILRLGVAVRRAADRNPPRAREIVFLMNAHDHTVSMSPVLDLGRAWTRSGAFVRVYELPDSLGLPHDVVDPSQPHSRADVLYPVFAALTHGEPPAALVAPRRE
jgi:esterase/lipase